jgi:hypothetical protein
MLDSSGNAYSYGAFYTQNTGDLGIKITNYDIVFTKRQSGVQDEGAISFTSNGSGQLAISGRNAVVLGKRTSNDNFDAMVALNMTTTTTCFHPANNNTVDLGTSGARWEKVFANNVMVNEELYFGTSTSTSPSIYADGYHLYFEDKDGVRYTVKFE